MAAHTVAHTAEKLAASAPSKGSLSRVPEATKKKIRKLFVEHAVPKLSLAARFQTSATIIGEILKGLKNEEATSTGQSLDCSTRHKWQRAKRAGWR